MGKVIAGMTMSLDGFIDADKVSPDFSELGRAAAFKEMLENTGAVIMGRHVYEMADPFMWANDGYELQIDITSVLVGKGLRLFENIDTAKIKLERTKVEEPTSVRTSITFKVAKTDSKN